MINKNDAKFDHEERTAKFAEDVLMLLKATKISVINESIMKQLIRSVTSIGANYCEATESITKKDFRHKIAIAKKEAKETMFWLRMFSNVEESHKTELVKHRQEARELVLIFAASIRNC